MEQSWKTSVPIHFMIALDLHKWVIKSTDKQRWGFLWKDAQQAKMAAIVLWLLGIIKETKIALWLGRLVESLLAS